MGISSDTRTPSRISIMSGADWHPERNRVTQQSPEGWSLYRDLKSGLSDAFSGNLRAAVRRGHALVTGKETDASLHAAFVDSYFDSVGEYEHYAAEFDEGEAVSLRNEALEQYHRLTGEEDLYGVGQEVARDYYALIRKLKPATVVETGVCNGVSTLAILLALRENGTGVLHSIDYPYRANESLAEFRAETFDKYGGAAIPSDKNPGWIIPNKLRDRWDLNIGRSQRELPRLLQELGGMDLFVHDSEHSHPCMMFEYELAHEWLTEGGVLLSDDITWNDAFETFIEARNPDWGRISRDVGYVRK